MAPRDEMGSVQIHQYTGELLDDYQLKFSPSPQKPPNTSPIELGESNASPTE